MTTTNRLDSHIAAAEEALYARYGVTVEQSQVTLPDSRSRVRVLSSGAGPDLVLVHGTALAAAAWAPWLTGLAGYRLHLVDMPGHGMSGPASYRQATARETGIAFIDDLLTALDLPSAPVVGHSVGGMYAMWHAAARPGRISRLILVGAPGGALPGVRLTLPVGLLTLPVLGPAMLRMPSPRRAYRGLLAHGMGSGIPAAPAELIDVLRLYARRPGSAATVGSQHRALDRFRVPRPETAMTAGELGRITVPALFCWGQGDPYLSPASARPLVGRIPRATLTEVAGGHAPWLDDPARCARLITDYLHSANGAAVTTSG
jgi:pimeloyl-ACP methyl ester carboxylesterase